MEGSSTSDGFPKSRPLFSSGRYENPWSTWNGLPNVFDLVKRKTVPKDEDNPKPDLSQELQVVTPVFVPTPENGIVATWLGHSTVLVQIEGKAILTDPILRWKRKRLRPPPCSVEDLPRIDAIVISHSHYDHLDYPTVSELNDRFGPGLVWYVPEGLTSWFSRSGCAKVVEMTWWQEDTLENSDLKVIALPCQHWSGRTPFDKNKSLWCSWALKGRRESFYFTGDTGYCPEFKSIGHYYGPFTLAAIPIGCYKPCWFMKNQHVDPADAVQIHKDLRAEHSFGVHWGTFDMGSESVLQPRRELSEQLLRANVDAKRFFTLNHGESWCSENM